jgi:hypothetical protein
MTATTPQRSVLSDDQIVEILGLLDKSDSAELKLTVPESGQRSTAVALGLDPLDAQIRQVFFFDTPDLTLHRNGIVTRARRIEGKGDDSVVKLRPVVPAELPAELRTSPNFVVEVDALPGGFVCSGSMKAPVGSIDVLASLGGKQPLRRMFSKEQRRLYAEHAPHGIELDDLTTLGPIFVLKLKFKPRQFKRFMVAEMWLYPDGDRILELSTKCPPSEAFQVAAESRAYLSGLGIDLFGEQQTKTLKALQFFAAGTV